MTPRQVSRAPRLTTPLAKNRTGAWRLGQAADAAPHQFLVRRTKLIYNDNHNLVRSTCEARPSTR